MSLAERIEHGPKRADPVAVFRARIEAQALQFATGADLAELLDGIEAAADQLVRAVEERSREAPISKTFARACRLADAEARSKRRRHELEPIPIVGTHVPGAAQLQAEYERTIQRHRERYGPTEATRDAAECFVSRDDPKQFEAWLLQHPVAERAAIVAHVKNKERPS
jgi:hypothetical protein